MPVVYAKTPKMSSTQSSAKHALMSLSNRPPGSSGPLAPQTLTTFRTS
jgi:hypothetical protein